MYQVSYYIITPNGGIREWRVYKNTDGVTTTIRKHLRGEHGKEYERVTAALGLKHADLRIDQPAVRAASTHAGPFVLEEWIKLLIRWIVIDDQVCNHSFVIAC
jgi:hypothetical protein